MATVVVVTIVINHNTNKSLVLRGGLLAPPPSGTGHGMGICVQLNVQGHRVVPIGVDCSGPH